MHTHGIPDGSAAQRPWQPVAVQFLPRHRVQIGRAWAEGPTLQRPAMARREVKTGAGLPTGDVATPEVRGHILARNAGHRWRGGRRHAGAPTLAWQIEGAQAAVALAQQQQRQTAGVLGAQAVGQIAQVIGIAVMQLLIEEREPSREALIEVIQVLWQGDQVELAVELALDVLMLREE